MPVVFSFDRKRAHVYPLLRQVRLFSALSLATGTHHSIRWIPSELSPSDLPSRRFEKVVPFYVDKYQLSGEVTAEHDRYGRFVFGLETHECVYSCDFVSEQVGCLLLVIC